MSRIIGFILMGVFAATAVSQETPKRSATVVKNEKDSTEYEVIIIDPQFDQWYLVNFSPAKDYTEPYYQTKNRVSVPIWNDYFLQGKYRNVIENYLDYRSDINYGIEVDRKIYWYFTYLQETYGVRLIY